MTSQDILASRLQNQLLISHPHKTPEDIVKWLGAVQSQDFPAAKWGLANRLDGTDDVRIQEDFDKGRFLRTHVLRPTWHFVHPQDISWMLTLTGERVKRIMRSYNRQMGLDEDVFQKSKKIIRKILKNKQYKTRKEIAKELESNKIDWRLNGLAHIVIMAEEDGLICSGPIRGKEHTYALLEERVDKQKKINREESIGELVKRYFISHGPAQIKDFVWWSGLTSKEAREGLEMNKSLIKSEEVNGKTYYFRPGKIDKIPDKVYLLPNYDEYGISYSDRDDFYDKKFKSFADARGDLIFQHLIIYQGTLIGTWKRILKKNSVILKKDFFEKPSYKILKLTEKSFDEYAKFLGFSSRHPLSN